MASPLTVGSSRTQPGSGAPTEPELAEQLFGADGLVTQSPGTLSSVSVLPPRRRPEGSLRLVTLQRDGQVVRAVLHPSGTPVSSAVSSAVSSSLEQAFQHALASLRSNGYCGVVTTPALAPQESMALQQLGFTVATSLVLLSRNTLGRPIGQRARKTQTTTFATVRSWPVRRSVTERQLREMLDVDAAAFPAGQSFDALALTDALRATPATRTRLALNHEGALVGFALSGTAGRRGYLQRLAVRPQAQGQSIGKLLCLDSVRWAGRRGAGVMAVNTQPTNTTALRLYARCGFERLPDPLHVLSLDLAEHETTSAPDDGDNK
jgi:ribosomal protein S18 acetylase RimI-like enzyme